MSRRPGGGDQVVTNALERVGWRDLNDVPWLLKAKWRRRGSLSQNDDVMKRGVFSPCQLFVCRQTDADS